jgi:hypothetical protein
MSRQVRKSLYESCGIFFCECMNLWINAKHCVQTEQNTLDNTLNAFGESYCVSLRFNKTKSLFISRAKQRERQLNTQTSLYKVIKINNHLQSLCAAFRNHALVWMDNFSELVNVFKADR